MHLAYAWRLAVRNYLVILLTALVGLGAAYGYTALTRSYSTTTYLTVLTKQEAAGLRAVDPQRFFETQAKAILSNEVLGKSVVALRDGTSVEQLREDIELSDGSESDVLGLTVSGPTPEVTKARQDAVLAAINGHRFADVTMAGLWTSPMVGPWRAKSGVIGLAAGAGLGLVLVLLWGAVRRPIYHPRYLQLSREVRTYPVVLDLKRPYEVQQFTSWLGHPANCVVAVGQAEGEAREMAAQVNVQQGAGGPSLLVAAVGRATELAVEEQASLDHQTLPPVLVVVSPTGWGWHVPLLPDQQPTQ